MRLFKRGERTDHSLQELASAIAAALPTYTPLDARLQDHEVQIAQNSASWHSLSISYNELANAMDQLRKENAQLHASLIEVNMILAEGADQGDSDA